MSEQSDGTSFFDAKIEVSYGPDYSDIGRPAEPMRENDGSFILMGGEGDNRTRVAVVDFQGKAKRGEAWRTPDPVGLGNAQRLADCWNAMFGVKDPEMFMDDLGELLSELSTYFDNKSDFQDGDYGTQEPNTEMRHYAAIRALFKRMEIAR